MSYHILFDLIWFADSKADFSLTDVYRCNHFLSGLLLQELKSALNEIQEVRRIAIATLRNQLAKHAWDDRYNQKEDANKKKVNFRHPVWRHIYLLDVYWIGMMYLMWRIWYHTS